MVATADVVNIPYRIIGGQTTPSSRYRYTSALHAELKFLELCHMKYTCTNVILK